MGKQGHKLKELLLQLGKSIQPGSIGGANSILSTRTKIKNCESNSKEIKVVPLRISKSRRRKNKLKLNRSNANVELIQSGQKSTVETVIFQNPDKKSHNEISDPPKKKKKMATDETDLDNLDIRKTRYEIMKFSLNALKGSEKEDAETNLAIKLGAQPPKKPYINYKELQIIRKTEKVVKAAEASSLAKPDLKVKMSNNKKNQKGKTTSKKVKYS